MNSCSNGHANPDGAQFCAACGLAISEQARLFPAVPPVQQPAPAWGSPPPLPNPYPVSSGAGFGASHVKRNGMGITALVLGILSILTGALGILLGALAIIFGGIGIGRANRGEATNKTMSGWGLGLGIAGMVLGLIYIAALA